MCPPLLLITLAAACGTSDSGGGGNAAPTVQSVPTTCADGSAPPPPDPGNQDAGGTVAVDSGSTDAKATDAAPPPPFTGGQLFIMGGNVQDASPIWDRVILESGGVKNMHFLVVSAAQSRPAVSFEYHRDIMVSKGVPVDQIVWAKIATEDDPTSATVDESTFKDGANSDAEVAKLDLANYVQFTGGDQARHVRALTNADGTDSKFLAKLRAKLAAGTISIGGSSAGAAIMTDPMIKGGTSMGALTLPYDVAGTTTDDSVTSGKGLGFVPNEMSLISDQHFFQRGRFARLLRVLSYAQKNVGIGLAEDSALLVNLAKKSSIIIGASDHAYAAILTRREATENIGPPFTGKGWRISVLTEGDQFLMPTEANPDGLAISHPSKQPYSKLFSEYYGPPALYTDVFGTMGLSNIAVDVADGTGNHVDGIAFQPAAAFTGGPSSFTGIYTRFTVDSKSRGAWGSAKGYSVINMLLEIGTMSGSITGMPAAP